MKSHQKCILCSSNNIVPHWNNARGYNVSKCLDCSFLFLNQIINKHELEDYYSQNYFMASYAKDEKKLIDVARNPKIISEAKEYASLIKFYQPNAHNVGEIGCSWGYLLYNLQSFGYSAKGFELSKTTAEVGSKQLGIKIIPGFFEAQDKQFDVLILRHVLEHVPNPQDLLEKIYASIKKDGLFILEGPNLDSISSRLFGKNVSWVSPPDHISFPNFRSLIMACEKLGLTCIYQNSRRGRGISVFHQALLNTVSLIFGGKERAKVNLGGINEKAPSQGLSSLKNAALKTVNFLDLLSSPIHPFLKQALLEEEMLIIFKKP
ncbi:MULTISPECIES: class I SAM-dependent methyltransferase [unclassified Nostoc]|uniref:class I SAM-dependent methyltransferase n=1 Tax=unclassified Nostoc TaxID=2593658 RepID=UPI002AD222D5|nr:MULTISPECIES: class I SAM-dependent methyltransferase [unclassified Nostoc]MDZ8125974.1 class I SAM-dependent methyltransferase [Nostoc sp. CmiVER01]MDZ8225840.1 class I SAM-dependent methyltransferase [Nostoc sp. ChiVER01]